jgi:hypothetical protein
VEFESPHRLLRAPPGSCPRSGGHRGRASPTAELRAITATGGAASFSPAMPGLSQARARRNSPPDPPDLSSEMSEQPEHAGYELAYQEGLRALSPSSRPYWMVCTDGPARSLRWLRS